MPVGTQLAHHGAARPTDAAEPQPRVGVTGLPELYQHGLSVGLTRAGLAAATLTSDADVAAFATAPGPRALVLPAERRDAVLARLGELADRPGLAVVVVLADTSASAHVEALSSRATGVIPADADLPHALLVVRAALAGHVVIPAQVMRSISRSTGAGLGRPPRVSEEEASWLRTLAEGDTVASLARQSGYSERAMYRQLAGLYRRLGAVSRTEALLRAQQWRLIEPAPRRD